MTASTTKDTSDPLRAHRFTGAVHPLLLEINASIDVDERLALIDLEGSIAHVRMLGDRGIVTAQESEILRQGLRTIEAEVASGIFRPDRALEDIHMNIEARLHRLVGPVAGKLHTARSRNDQVALDSRLWVRQATRTMDDLLKGLLHALLDRAEKEAASPMPGFTHLQSAQPVTIGHHLLAYAEMLHRDRKRFAAAEERADESPLGAAALAGSGYSIDPAATASALGFAAPMRNSIDAVSDRDFMLDFLHAVATLGMHLSRLSEELVIWSSTQFAYVRLPEGLSAGSSIMPQKQNPDAAELIRAKSGRLVGDLVTLLVVMKGLPLAYSRDMQEDKEPVFDAADTIDLCVRTMTALVQGLEFDRERMRRDAERGGALATEIADWLVEQRRLPFREAHGVVASLVSALEQDGLELHEIDAVSIVAYSPALEGIPTSVLDLEHALSRRTSTGGTAPALVARAVQDLRRRTDALLPDRSTLSDRSGS